MWAVACRALMLPGVSAHERACFPPKTPEEALPPSCSVYNVKKKKKKKRARMIMNWNRKRIEVIAERICCVYHTPQKNRADARSANDYRQSWIHVKTLSPRPVLTIWSPVTSFQHKFKKKTKHGRHHYANNDPSAVALGEQTVGAV